jgi:predicted lipoprotein with Yx(FWY)xxD motif
MKNRVATIVLAAAAASLAACATMGPPDPAKVADGVFVNSAGMTLYTFDRDVSGSGKSACNGPCAANWPPFMVAGAGESSAAWQVITRDDGSKQWAYLGKPLYTWSKDTKPGDRTGDGFNHTWTLATPQ